MRSKRYFVCAVCGFRTGRAHKLHQHARDKVSDPAHFNDNHDRRFFHIMRTGVEARV